MKGGDQSTGRSDGFAGSLQIRVLAQVQREWRNNPIVAGLYPTAAGFFPNADCHFVAREDGVADGFILIECVSGQGWFESREFVAVESGQVLLFEASRAHAYGAAFDNPWSINWVHFDGSIAPHFFGILKDRDTESPIVVKKPIGRDLSINSVYAALKENAELQATLEACVELRRVLTKLREYRLITEQTSTLDRVRESIEWMRRRRDQKITLDELASHSGLSRAHYSELFKKLTGRPPMQFFLQSKMQLAAQLLQESSVSIQEVATAVGISDPFYFSRLFKRFAGVSPRSYRSLPQG